MAHSNLPKAPLPPGATDAALDVIDEALPDITFTDLLPAHIAKKLQSAGIETLAQLKEKTQHELLQIPKMGEDRKAGGRQRCRSFDRQAAQESEKGCRQKTEERTQGLEDHKSTEAQSAAYNRFICCRCQEDESQHRDRGDRGVGRSWHEHPVVPDGDEAEERYAAGRRAEGAGKSGEGRVKAPWLAFLYAGVVRLGVPPPVHFKRLQRVYNTRCLFYLPVYREDPVRAESGEMRILSVAACN